jgi:hypothetical protein
VTTLATEKQAAKPKIQTEAIKQEGYQSKVNAPIMSLNGAVKYT